MSLIYRTAFVTYICLEADPSTADLCVPVSTITPMHRLSPLHCLFRPSLLSPRNDTFCASARPATEVRGCLGLHSTHGSFCTESGAAACLAHASTLSLQGHSVWLY